MMQLRRFTRIARRSGHALLHILTRHVCPKYLGSNTAYGSFLLQGRRNSMKISVRPEKNQLCSSFRLRTAGQLLVALSLLFVSLVNQPCKAQVLFGSIVGSVTDSTGAVVPNATVTVTETRTGASREVAANGVGNYIISTVPAGVYTVTVSAPKFATFSTSNIAVTINTTVRVDAALQVGAQTEVVSVSASEVAQLQTDTVDVHAELNTQALQNIPQATTTYEELVGRMPGATPPSNQSGGTNNPSRSLEISMNGTSNEGANVSIDGVSAINPWVQFYSTAVPSTEAIETVNVVAASPQADQGAVNGASIRVQIKTGTNQLHGEAYEYNVTNATEAIPYFQPSTFRKPKYIDNDLGATIGGPIVKNKAFFFGSYEGEFTRQASGGFYTLPTPNMVSGVLASTTPVFDPATGNADGSNRTAFSQDSSGRYIIPAARFDVVSKKLLTLLSSIPTLPSGGVPEGVFSNNVYINTPSSYNLQKIDTKVNWNTTKNLQLIGRVSDYPYAQYTAPPFGQYIQDGGTNAYGNIYAISASATYVARPNLVIDATWGLTHTLQNLYPPLSNQRYGQDVLGIPNSNAGPLPTAGGVPQFKFSGLSSWGYGYPALIYDDPVFEYTGNATWNKGRHSIRLGIDISQQHMNHKEVATTSFTFTGGLTGLFCPTGSSNPSCASGSPKTSVFNSWADFLVGLPQSTGNNQLTTDWVTMRTWQYSPYVADTWQMTRKMTVVVGTAWDLFPIPSRQDHEMEYFDPTTGDYYVCGLGNVTHNCGVTIQHYLFAPRLGATYRLTDKTVLRAGFSLQPEQVNMLRDGLYNYPVNIAQAFSGGNSYTSPGLLEQGFPTIAVPNVSGGIVPLPGIVGVVSAPQNFVRGYTESQNISVQRELGWGTLVQVGYVGTLNVHDHARVNVNYGLPGGGQASQQLYNLTTSSTGGGFTAAEVIILPTNHSNYQSLQVSGTKRFSGGLQFQANYVWSHWVGICCSENGDSTPNIPIPQYFYLNKATMPDDRKHNFEFQEVYQLPFGKGNKYMNTGIASSVLGGWQLSSVIARYSGSMFTATSPANSLNAPGNSQMANKVKSGPVTISGYHGTTSHYFDTSAFAQVTTAAFGTAGFDSLRGPGFFDINANLMRTFPIHDNLQLQFRLQALNLFNHPNFANPNADSSSPNFGIISANNAGTSPVAQRFLKVGAKLFF